MTEKLLECKSCHRKLPEKDYYPSSLDKGSIYCKECYKKWTRKANKKHRLKMKELKKSRENEPFDKLFGGYVISMVYNTLGEDFKYSIYSTKTGKTLYFNKSVDLEKHFHEALHDVKTGVHSVLDKETLNGQKKD